MFLATVLFFALQSAPSCQIPAGILIQAENPCWTWQWLKEEYPAAEADVGFSRWLTDRPFSPQSLDDISLRILEHPDIFYISGGPAMGALKVGGLHVIGPNQIEYSKKHALLYRNLIMRHELGHLRELEEELKLTPFSIFLSFGWWHFGHGDTLDPLVKTVNFVTRWFYRGLPENSSYWPGLIGHPPDKGTPGSEVKEGALPPISLDVQQYFLNLDEEYQLAACIISVPKN